MSQSGGELVDRGGWKYVGDTDGIPTYKHRGEARGDGGWGRAALGLIPFFDAGAALLQRNYGAAAGHAAFELATIVFPVARIAKLSKVVKHVKDVRQIGQFTIKTKVIPGRGPGMSRAELTTTVRNAQGTVIRTFKDSFDRGNVFQHRKALRGGPEARAR